MNSKEVITELQTKFPDKTILKLPSENPSEIICEIEPTSEHSERSVAIAVIDKSEPHVHYRSTEVYEVVRGEVNLFVEGEQQIMKEGAVYTIEPGKVHWAIADAAMVRVTSNPGWTMEDHIIVPDAQTNT